MAIEFNCNGCARLLRVADETAGQRARCPACGWVNQIPAAGAPPISDGSTPAPQTYGVAPSPLQTNVDERLATVPPARPDAENPYQSPATIEPWDGRDVYRPIGRDYVLASRWTRFAGAILDTLIYLVGMVPGFIIMAMVAEEDGPEAEMPGIILMLGGLGVVAIINWVLITQSGQSLAKRLLGMRIVRIEDGALPGFVRGVILRIWLPALINQFCSLFGLLDALWIFGEPRRCLHDHIASTRVVDVRYTDEDPWNR